MYSRRLQGNNSDKIIYKTNTVFWLIIVQERLTREIAEAINKAVEPKGVGVIVECV